MKLSDILTALPDIAIFEGVRDNDFGLPADVFDAFIALGENQRGKPEAAMLRVQRIFGGGILNPVVEHVGDLTHRMAAAVAWGKASHAGAEFVAEKTGKMLRYLTQKYGFERELEGNIKNNARFNEVDEVEFRKKIDDALMKYAQAHRELVVYNRPQWLAREAAIAIGEKRWTDVIKHLKELDEIVLGARWVEEATAFTRDSNGKLKPYEA